MSKSISQETSVTSDSALPQSSQQTETMEEVDLSNLSAQDAELVNLSIKYNLKELYPDLTEGTMTSEELRAAIQKYALTEMRKENKQKQAAQKEKTCTNLMDMMKSSEESSILQKKRKITQYQVVPQGERESFLHHPYYHSSFQKTVRETIIALEQPYQLYSTPYNSEYHVKLQADYQSFKFMPGVPETEVAGESTKTQFDKLVFRLLSVAQHYRSENVDGFLDHIAYDFLHNDNGIRWMSLFGGQMKMWLTSSRIVRFNPAVGKYIRKIQPKCTLDELQRSQTSSCTYDI